MRTEGGATIDPDGAAQEPAASDPVPAVRAAITSRRAWAMLALAWTAGFTALFDSSVVSLALTDIASDLNRSVTDLAWIVTAFLLPMAGTLVAAGRLADRFGARRVLAGGALLLLLSTAVAVVAPSFEALIGSRVAQGLGAAALYTLSLAIAATAFPADRRATAIAIYFTGGALGAVIGPPVGGLLTAVGGWRTVFVAQLPMMALVVVLALVLMPRSRGRAGSLDWPGILFASLALLAANWALLEIPDTGIAGVPVVTGLAVAVLAGVALVWRERRVSEPAIPLAAFRNRRFVVASLAGAGAWFAISSGTVYPALYLQGARGFDPATAGLLLLPTPLAALVLFPFGARLVRAVGPDRGMAVGLALTLIGSLATLTWGASAETWWIMLVLAVTGIGLAVTLVASAADALAQFAPSEAGMGSAIFNSVRQLGAAVGVGLPAVAWALASGGATSSSAALLGSDAAFVTRTVVLLVPLLVVLWVAVGSRRSAIGAPAG